MAAFTYRAVDSRGVPAQGEVHGQDATAVLRQLRSRGLIVLKFAEEKPADVGDILGRFRNVRARDLTVMTRQLATMVSAGVPLLRGLFVLEDQTTEKQLKEIIVDVRKQVESGAPLSDSLARHPRAFNELYIAMVRSGETAGTLDETLIRVADQLEKADSLRRQLRAAMVYPSVVGGVAVAVLLALVAFLIPVFEKMFKQVDPANSSLPALTKVMVAASHALTGYWYVLIVAVIGLVLGFRHWKRSKSGKAQWERFKIRIPFRIGRVIHKVALARFSRTFASLTAAGVPILEAIDITARTAGNAVIEDAMTKVGESVRGGGTLAAPMRDSPEAFPPMVPHMIGIGEDSGALEQMLAKVADFYEDEVAAAVKGLSALLEPVMLLVVGAMVGVIVISMYLPLFSLYDKIK